MKASDLRIGNYIDDGYGNPLIVTATNEVMTCSNNWGFEDQDLKPIPLTPEILETAGFRIDVACNECQINQGCEFTLGSLDGADAYFVYEIKMDGFALLKYVHQLQNLFFCLTGTELEIKL